MILDLFLNSTFDFVGWRVTGSRSVLRHIGTCNSVCVLRASQTLEHQLFEAEE